MIFGDYDMLNVGNTLGIEDNEEDFSHFSDREYIASLFNDVLECVYPEYKLGVLELLNHIVEFNQIRVTSEIHDLLS